LIWEVRPRRENKKKKQNTKKVLASGSFRKLKKNRLAQGGGRGGGKKLVLRVQKKKKILPSPKRGGAEGVFKWSQKKEARTSDEGRIRGVVARKVPAPHLSIERRKRNAGTKRGGSAARQGPQKPKGEGKLRTQKRNGCMLDFRLKGGKTRQVPAKRGERK